MFEFSLQQIASTLEREAVEQGMVLREVRQRLEAGQQEVTSAGREIDRAQTLRREQLAPGKQFGTAELRRSGDYLEERSRNLEAKVETLDALTLQYDEQRERLQASMVAQQAVERLRERRLREYQEDQQRRGQKDDDALWLAMRGQDAEEQKDA